ncbi:uncharacterized protein LACBIDRAFT_304911 [Laccaria bicolor S238N-H82]|uniref:Predicted protein n=1 Tax=Laccaria bicolor (strain S238N-H82 / ATCC MYA-4686) TaxID=486041 RepID=B0DMM2_LACBS|nr:uncharacterized protein LACBIDRAFT_304911 [Laccaria bicolor S238N-H82]EDR04309.1 predicted protein [Laccaria bicolor S238N-H82]|eukprot:XP_001885200.1 predicted protein [Laccaria bicolor S238N-H82]
MIRPPPLNLKRIDNRFGPPAAVPYLPRQSKQKKTTFFAVLYKANWRNIIIAVAGLNALRFALAAHNALQDARVDDNQHIPQLATISIALGVMYILSTVIEIFGVISVSTKRLPLIRLYTCFALLASVFVTVAGVLEAVSYFVFAEDLMYECVALAIRGQSYQKSTFRGRPWPGSIYAIGRREAQRQCISAWINESWTQIANCFLFAFIPAVIYFIMAYTYYRQTTDPRHVGNLLRNPARSSRHGSESHPDVNYGLVHSNTSRAPLVGDNNTSHRLRSGSRVGSKSKQQPQHAQRGPGSLVTVPSVSRVTATTTRGLKRDHRPPALMKSASPVFSGEYGYVASPGPPTYSAHAGATYALGHGMVGTGSSILSAGYSKYL